MAIVGSFFGSFMYFLLRGVILVVCVIVLCVVYTLLRGVLLIVCMIVASFVCGSVGPNPHALSALTTTST